MSLTRSLPPPATVVWSATARWVGLLAALVLCVPVPAAQATDFCDGLCTAVPVKEGRPPVIDGDLGDWDLSAQEPVIVSAQSADAMNADWTVMYDGDALYFGAKVSLPGRALFNPYNPQDAYWGGDILQVRLSSDPALAYPLDRDRDKASQRVSHVSFWQNHLTGKSFVSIKRGTNLNLGETVLSAPSEICIKTDGDKGYVMEARLPWSALDVPGGKNPFKADQKTAFLAETLWVGGDKSRTVLCYRQNPGVFAFHSPNAWGQLVFAAKSPGQRVRPPLVRVIADAKATLTASAPKMGVPFEVDVPADGLKVSVNIVGKNGEVIRELLGAEPHPRGKCEVRWDGLDAFGRALAPGTYQWSAYFHRPLAAEYQGGVGASGHPFHTTFDGTGAWGGDHTNPADAAAAGNALYLLWPTGEASPPLVKTDLDGKVIWRKNPFVGGGFGPFHAVAATDKHVFLSRSSDRDTAGVHLSPNETLTLLVRLDAQTGGLLTWGEGGPSEIPVHQAAFTMLRADRVPSEIPPPRNQTYPRGLTRQPDCVGLAAGGGKVFLSSYASNKIFVVDAETGKITDELACPGPRGLTLTSAGDLLAVSFVEGKAAAVVRFAKGGGAALPFVGSGLEAPYDVAVDKEGRIAVTDLGASNQVKIFDPAGQPLRELGRKGGRPWQGRYAPGELAFLKPAGLAVDAGGAIVVAESAPPKVFSRIGLADGKLLNRWYGSGVYWNSTWPMPDDPRHAFYLLNGAVGRGWVKGPDVTGVPDAYWAPDQAGYEHLENLEEGIPQPEVIRAKNGELYFVKDARQHAICLLKDDLMRPVATWAPADAREKPTAAARPCLDVWIDRNGDGQVQPDEQTRLTKLADGKPLPDIARGTSSMHMEPGGDLYFTTGQNCILKIPAKGFGPGGVLDWDVARAVLVVPEVMPGLTRMPTGYRAGLLGVRVDEAGDIYTAFNVRLKGGTGPYDFPDPETAKRMLDGMGHSAESNVVKFAKFDPRGKLLWMAGRKATAGAAPGEMYHFWNLSGLVNDRYIAGASEWGQIYLYTHDGFFVDALMNNPGDVSPPGPYTFGGETSGGRVAYFPASGELWAYSSGMAYKVNGFSKGVVENEGRASGMVQLDKVYLPTPSAKPAAGPLVIAPIQGNSLTDPHAWDGVPSFAVLNGGKPVAQAQLAYNKDSLCVRVQVNDDSPLENGATQDELVFKGGDTAGIVLGPDHPDGKAGPGDVRFMAAKIQGQPKLIAMKAVTTQPKKPFEYYTPAAGKWTFEYVGEVPGAQVELRPVAGGYVATFTVPRSFLEFPLGPGAALKGDVEVRFSGAGARGLQTVGRAYLFTPATAETTMTDDVPTEARLYPQHWGPVKVP